MRTIPASIPPAQINEPEPIAEAKALLARLQVAESYRPSPLFGELNAEQWRLLHLSHTAHHSSFRTPREPN